MYFSNYAEGFNELFRNASALKKLFHTNTMKLCITEQNILSSQSVVHDHSTIPIDESCYNSTNTLCTSETITVYQK